MLETVQCDSMNSCPCCADDLDTAEQAQIMTYVVFPARQKFHLYISQDGNQSGIAELSRGHAPSIYHMQHAAKDNFPTRKKSEAVAYYRIASHYKYIMQQMFDCWQYPKVIFLEVRLPFHQVHALPLFLHV